jgi:hypothetical protein
MSVQYRNFSCLDSIIALDADCENNESTSGLYASSIGITPDFLSNIITKPYASVQSLFDAKKSLAISTITNQLHSHFLPQYKSGSVIDNFRVGTYNENKVAVAATDAYKGILFTLTPNNSYLDFFLAEISLFVNYTGNVTVNVFDLIQDKVLEQHIVPCVAGEISTIYPQVKYPSARRQLQLYIAYDTTGIPSYKTTVSRSSCSTCKPQGVVRNSYEEIYSKALPLADDAIRANLTGVTDTGGLSVVHSLQCNHTDWLCSISNLIALPVLYKTASLILEYSLLESPNARVNASVTLNADLIKQRLDVAEYKYNESMQNIISNIHPPTDEHCFTCRSKVRHAIVLP